MELTVDSITSAYASGAVSPVEVLDSCLQRIDDLDADLNAFVLVDRDRARAAARASERRWRDGAPLSSIDGVPTSIKDLVLVEGWPTRKGSVHTDESPSSETAPVAKRLLEAGAVPVGKTTTPEFGWKGVGDSPFSGVTRNPWNRELGPGGSSAGAAVAAATGMAVLNVGTDGGGSIRMPSAFCGVFGLKPTLAIIPMYPPGGSGLLSHLGPMTPTVRDAAHMMAVMAQPDSREIYPTLADPRSWLEGIDDGVRGMRIAYCPDFPHARVDPEITAAVEGSLELLRGMGAVVERVHPQLPDCRQAFLALWDPALGRSITGLDEAQLASCDAGLVDTLIRGRALSAMDFLDANSVRDSATLALSRVLDQHDLIVTPQLPITAFAVGSDVADPSVQDHWIDWTPYTYPINMTRNPAASVPVGLSSAGLPMALQIIGRHYDDRRVLRAARALETVRPFDRLA